MSLTNQTCRMSRPAWLDTYNGGSCVTLKSSDSHRILSTCCNTTINNIESHNLTNWSQIGSMQDQVFGEFESQAGCAVEYCNVSRSNVSMENYLAVELFYGCVETVFPEAKNHSGCYTVTSKTNIPASEGSIGVVASKAGLMLFLIGVVGLMV